MKEKSQSFDSIKEEDKTKKGQKPNFFFDETENNQKKETSRSIEKHKKSSTVLSTTSRGNVDDMPTPLSSDSQFYNKVNDD